MDDRRLRAEVEKRVREMFEPGLANVARQPLTDEQKRARLETMPESFRQIIGENGWPEPVEVSDEAKESYIQQEVDELLAILTEGRESKAESGPLTDDDFNFACMQKPGRAVADHMLFRLKAQPPHPLLKVFIDMCEQDKKDLEILQNSPTEEQVSEISERIEARLKELKPDEFMRNAQEILEREDNDDNH